MKNIGTFLQILDCIALKVWATAYRKLANIRKINANSQIHANLQAICAKKVVSFTNFWVKW